MTAAPMTADDIETMRALLIEFDECALYDATMEGPRFKGWNRSALDRLRPKVRGFVADMLALDATTPAGERG